MKICNPIRMIRAGICALTLLSGSVTLLPAQQVPGNESIDVVPPMVKFSGVLVDDSGKPPAGIVGVTFSLYRDQQGGAPLWMDTQNVQPDKAGHYSVMLGSASSKSLPADLFASGEPRWVGVQLQGQAEQARVMLVSVPYAMKAGDAQTVGGLPASAFVLAGPSNVVGSSATSAAGRVSTASVVVPGSITGGGTTGFLPKFTGAATIGNSAVFQSGSNVGIGTSAPAFPLTLVSSSYQPLFVQSSSNFGTWLQLNNTSTGGHNWAILSSASGNSEGAGNLGITNFTGKSTIFLEGNVNVGANLNVAGTVNPLTIVGNNTFLPLTLQSPSTFGTWLELNNTSAGGHNWAILSSASGNSEGAGNLGITNFTGNSTIFLEGNVRANSLNSSGNVAVGGNLDIGFSYVIGPNTTVTAGTEATMTAICPAGTVIMSGGFDISPGPNGAQVLSNVPGLVGQDRWIVRIRNTGGPDITAVAEAVCARLVVAQCCS